MPSLMGSAHLGALRRQAQRSKLPIQCRTRALCPGQLARRQSTERCLHTQEPIVSRRNALELLQKNNDGNWQPYVDDRSEVFKSPKPFLLESPITMAYAIRAGTGGCQKSFSFRFCALHDYR
jgi:hypothetical protein